MEVRVEHSALADAVAWTARTVPKNVGPLSAIILRASGEQLQLSSFNLDMSSRATTDAVVEGEGEAYVPGRLLMEIARNLPSSGVTMVTEGNRVVMRCGRSEFFLPLMPEDDYPPLPKLPPVVGSTPGSDFATAVSQTAIACSKVDTTQVFTGIRLEIEGETLTLAATDRYRLAVRELQWLPDTPGLTRNVIVPGKGLADVARALATTPSVSLALSEDERELGIEAEGKRFTTRLLEGQFPKFRDLLPTEFQGTVRVKVDELTEAVKRVSLVAERNMPVRLEISEEEVTLRAGAQEESHAREAVACQLDGPTMTIAFNPAYLLDGLGELNSEVVELRFNEANRPAVIRGAENFEDEAIESFNYLLMPVKI